MLAWVFAVALLAGAGIVYTQGRSAAELHADAQHAEEQARIRATRSPSPGPTTTKVAPFPSVAAPVTSRPGVSEPGTLIQARMTSATTLDVSETLRSANPVSSVRVAPPVLRAAGAEFGDTVPVLTSVQVTADGALVPVLDAEVSAPLDLDLPAPARSIEVRFLLRGAIVRSVPSKAGRALSALSPTVTAEGSSATPVSFVFGGEEIIGLSCPALGATNYACAEGAPPRLSVRSPLPRERAIVLLQVTVPSL